MKKIACMLSMLLILISANAQTLRGDVNGDGKVDASDVSDLVTIILNAGLTEDDIYKKYNTPAISWIDDDFAAFDKQGKLTPVYQKLHDFCIAKGIYGDLALRPFSSPADAWIPTGMVDICKQWQSEGFEFLYHPNHSEGWYDRDAQHPHDASKIEASALDCIKAFKLYGLNAPSILVWPGNSAEFPDNMPIVKKLFECAVAATYNLINHNSDNDRHSLKRLSFESLSRGWLTKTQMKKRIKDAIDNGDWVILGSHFNSRNARRNVVQHRQRARNPRIRTQPLPHTPHLRRMEPTQAHVAPPRKITPTPPPTQFTHRIANWCKKCWWCEN